MPINLDTPMFFSGDVARAVGIDGPTLKNWINRGAILMSDEDRASVGLDGPSQERVSTGSGRSHLFTLRRVIQIAIIAELKKYGIPPSAAGMIALKFTDTGHGPTGYAGDPGRKSRPPRNPGQLYKDALTLLVVQPDGNARVIRAEEDTPISKLFEAGPLDVRSAVVVNLTKICHGVAAALGVGYPD